MPRFVFLVLEEHPWGRAMLRQVVTRGHIPALIVQEASETADVEREKFLRRMAGQPAFPEVAHQAAELEIPVERVPNHNDPSCRAWIEAVNPEVIVLGGTRILRRSVLDGYPPGHTPAFVNAHPGLLPWLRGSASVGWALYHNLPVGATVHFIDPGIDTGDIILRQKLPVTRCDTYESLNYRVAELAAVLMADVLDLFAAGNIPREPQDRSVGQTFRVIPDELLQEAIERLRAGQYAHYASGEDEAS